MNGVFISALQGLTKTKTKLKEERSKLIKGGVIKYEDGKS